MTKIHELKPEFVETMPEKKENGVLYISEKFQLAIHLCACRECNFETVTPFGESSNRWELINNEGLITLNPSIGNFQFP